MAGREAMATVRALILLGLAVLAPLAAVAEEQINLFDVTIDVKRNGDIVVAERIEVTAEASQIRRGIFRDLPRYFERDGRRYAYDYDVLSVKRDGRKEPYARSDEGGAMRLLIGDEDVFLSPDIYTYEIEYRVKNQVRYFETYDEVYWNATGTYWAFPIVKARAKVVLPDGARVTQTSVYTGAMGETGSDARYTQQDGAQVFETTRILEAREGMTVAVGFEKGVIDPPSAADETALLWQRYGALGILMASLGGVVWFLWRSFDRVGRDPVKGPVFPIYEAPAGYSPAAVHHIYHRGIKNNDAFIATLMNLAVKERISIDASDKKSTVLIRTPETQTGVDVTGFAPEDISLENKLFGGGSQREFGKKYDAAFTSAYTAFRRTIMSKYGEKYFRWNVSYTIAAVVLSAIGIGIAATQAVNWTLGLTFVVLALAAVNLFFMYLMPAPTPKGQKIRTEIEGFRLYLETAEKLQLNATEVGSDAPPMMSKERYERFLPFAVALGVEKPWTKYFEKVLPDEASNYHPAWGRAGSYRSIGDMNKGIMDSMNSGVSSSLPQSSGSSGSGGGGSSGGGGGGGGGGGW